MSDSAITMTSSTNRPEESYAHILMNTSDFIWGFGANASTSFLFNGMTMSSQDVGNHHFGVMVKANKLFTEKFALLMAGLYQIYSGTSRPEWIQFQDSPSSIITQTGYSSKIYIKTMSPPYGDDPRDSKWIIEGFNYWNNHF